jgi:polyhydroxybutyrate depolymerase
MMRNATVIALLTGGLAACGSETTPTGGTGGVAGTGGSVTDGGPGSSGGATSQGGTVGTGGASGGRVAGAGGTGGATGPGGTTGNGGRSGSGGATSSGGMGGRPSAGGSTGGGGVTSTGGMTSSGGVTSTGGMTSSGGATSTGGATSSGGVTSPGGGAGRGGTAATGGATASNTGGASGSAGQPDAGTPPPPVCTTDSTLSAGDHRATLQQGSRSRSYLVHVPRSVESGTAVALVLDFHGSGDTSEGQESASGWREKADQEGFIVVYPDGVGKGWNVGNCCGQALSENVDDVGFTRAVIEAVSKAACIDPKRVYATGMSNGAGFVHRLACEAADVIAAIAAASADLVTDPCTPARPISELSVRGLDDTMVAYEGGNTGSTGWYSPGAKKTLELWKEIDQCSGTADTSRQYCETYASCSAGVEISLCSLPNTGHGLYQNPVGFNVPEVAWEMFLRQPMP